MASHTIYAPTVNSYEPAFNYRENENVKGVCRVYFVLSDYNIRSDVEYVHASVVKASTNHNVVDTTRNYLTSEDIFTNAGIILNLDIHGADGKHGLYYTEISGDYIWTKIKNREAKASPKLKFYVFNLFNKLKYFIISHH